MKTLSRAIILGLLSVGFLGCSADEKKENQQEAYFNEQEDRQGYPVLVASPTILEYGLPFCEKEYCLEVELFGFNSKDEWFNQYVAQQIADIIRRQLGLSQKQSIQSAVDEFVKQSDSWQEETKRLHKPWTMHVTSKVIWQEQALAVLEIESEYTLGDDIIPSQKFYFVVDRKNKKTIKLYDLITEEARLEFNSFIQKNYQEWKDQQAEKSRLPEKVYWANQDWFLDDEGLVIYYRALDFDENLSQDLYIYMIKDQSNNWIHKEYLNKLYLN